MPSFSCFSFFLFFFWAKSEIRIFERELARTVNDMVNEHNVIRICPQRDTDLDLNPVYRRVDLIRPTYKDQAGKQSELSRVHPMTYRSGRKLDRYSSLMIART